MSKGKMNLEEKVLIKYYEGREFILRAKADGEIADFGPFEQHEFARFFAESDWDDPKAALNELHPGKLRERGRE